MPVDKKISFPKRHAHMVACDSDGCVFDVMDLKQRECFCPAFIKHFHLQRCARQAREVWEFVNLRSRTRGCNRFKAVVLALECLAAHPDVRALDTRLMDTGALRRFVASTDTLGEPALTRAVEKTGDPALRAMLGWTREVNAAVAAMCEGISPFAGAADMLRAVSGQADLVVVSQAPRATLAGEWARAGLGNGAAFIAGQEFGSKAAQIRQAMEGRYAAEQVLVLGDAPGDQLAAESVGAKFFPITPGAETESWQRFAGEGFPRFLSGGFDAAYQDELNTAFNKALPACPAWL